MIVLGPVPPPLGGFSYITERMVAQLAVRRPVLLLNRSRRPSSGRSGTVLHAIGDSLVLLARFTFALLRGRRGPLYVALSGGRGQWIDIAFLIIARAFRLRILIHHHSFAYLNRPSLSARWTLRITKRSVHIVLCETMGGLLARRFDLDPGAVRTLSNAVFLPEHPAPLALCEVRNDAPLIVGFLGNITDEKGIFTFIDTVTTAQRAGHAVRGRIAGPVQPSIRAAFGAALDHGDAFEYLGPVYGDAKSRFLESLDVLLFPSRYVNEAEPVTILEALAANIYVLTTDRGCCASMITRQAAGQVLDESDFVARASAVLANPHHVRECIAQHGPYAQYRLVRTLNESRLAAILESCAT